MEKVICVLVLYNPNIDLLTKVVSAILPQGEFIFNIRNII